MPLDPLRKEPSPDMRRSESRLRPLPAFLLAGLAVLFAVSACQKRGYTPLPADSTAVATDSSAIELRALQSAWESGENPERAAEASARILHRELASYPQTEWPTRAESFLDSLGLGAELVRGPCAMVVNFFSRSDPTAGSWPYLYSCGEKGLNYQAIEGKGMKVTALATRFLLEDEKPEADQPPGAAVLFSRGARGGQQPMLMVWQATAGRWKLVQTLGPDSLGTYGTGEFETPDFLTAALVTRTYRTPPSFEECATCPHVYVLGRFVWGEKGFTRTEQRYVPSPYSTFVRLVRALGQSDHVTAMALVASPDVLAEAERLEWNRSKGSWRVSPGTEETPGRLTIFRGQQEAYRVEFETPIVTDGDWVVTQIVPVPRAME